MIEFLTLMYFSFDDVLADVGFYEERMQALESLENLE